MVTGQVKINRKMTVSDDEAAYNRTYPRTPLPSRLKRSLDDSELLTAQFERSACMRKPPTAFLHSEDWGLYLRTCCHLRQIKSNYGCTEIEAEQLLQGTRNTRRSCVLRLIVAFNHLYSEYIKLAERVEISQQKQCSHCKLGLRTPNVKSSEDFQLVTTTPTPKRRSTTECHRSGDGHKTPSMDKRPHSGAQVTTSGTVVNSTSVSIPLPSTQTSRTIREVSDVSAYSTDTCHQPLAHVCFPWCHRTSRKPPTLPLSSSREALRIARELSGNTSNKHANPQEYFDRICRKPSENSLIVYQLVNHQCRVEHRIQLPQIIDLGFDQTLTPYGQMTTIQLPIALELILPKMQKKIERIFHKCPFIYDPLEVAAELRQLNYDTEACISHFQKTRQLRDIIHEFLPPKAGQHEAHPHRVVQSSDDRGALQMNSNRMSGMKGGQSSILIHNIQSIVHSLRKTQLDASRRLQKLRLFATSLRDHLESIIDELVLTAINNSPRLEKWILNQRGDLPYSQLGKLTQENRTLRQTLRLEEDRRKTMFNMMQEYLGNIRVYCRCRGIPHSRTCIEIASLDTILFHNGSEQGTEQYKFDRVFDCNASQAEVYTEFAPSVCSFLDGYNVCFLTYGGEASGKTYTLLGGSDGTQETQGIAHRALHTILSERDARIQEWDYNLTVAVVEIYNDSVNDLLGDETGVHVHVDSGLERMIDNLESMRIVHGTDIEQLLHLCRAQRRTGRTALNDHSSRSHLILFARLDAESHIHETKLRSILALCDLAGFEDIIKAETLGDPVLAKEAGYINRSLTALNRVFMSLRLQEPNSVSYRDSKLTYLLKPFFTYSGKCILIVTVRTDKVNLASTQSTLRFGREARGVSLGRARRQFNLDKLFEDFRNG